MVRRVLVRIEGDVDALLRTWTAPPDAEVTRDGDEADVILASSAAVAELDSLKAAARSLPAGAVDALPIFQAFDFTTVDLDAAPALSVRVLGGPEIEVEPLTDRVICGTCGEVRRVLPPVERVTATAR